MLYVEAVEFVFGSSTFYIQYVKYVEAQGIQSRWKCVSETPLHRFKHKDTGTLSEEQRIVDGSIQLSLSFFLLFTK